MLRWMCRRRAHRSTSSTRRGACLWRGKTLTDPDALTEALAPFAGDLAKVGLETGGWSTWLWHGLCERGLPAVCMDARQAHAVLSVTINKTDANDARGLAHLLRTGLYREVRVKSWDDMRKRALLRARATMVRTVIDLANAIRGALRTFGFNLAAGPGNGGALAFERRATAHLATRPDLMPVVAPLLDAWRAARAQVARHDRAVRAIVRADPPCRLLMTAPGVGHLTALSFSGAIGDPNAFQSGRTAAAWIGLTPRRHQSGTIDMQGAHLPAGRQAPAIVSLRGRGPHPDAFEDRQRAAPMGAEPARARRLQARHGGGWRASSPWCCTRCGAAGARSRPPAWRGRRVTSNRELRVERGQPKEAHVGIRCPCGGGGVRRDAEHDHRVTCAATAPGRIAHRDIAGSRLEAHRAAAAPCRARADRGDNPDPGHAHPPKVEDRSTPRRSRLGQL